MFNIRNLFAPSENRPLLGLGAATGGWRYPSLLVVGKYPLADATCTAESLLDLACRVVIVVVVVVVVGCCASLEPCRSSYICCLDNPSPRMTRLVVRPILNDSYIAPALLVMRLPVFVFSFARFTSSFMLGIGSGFRSVPYCLDISGSSRYAIGSDCLCLEEETISGPILAQQQRLFVITHLVEYVIHVICSWIAEWGIATWDICDGARHGFPRGDSLSFDKKHHTSRRAKLKEVFYRKQQRRRYVNRGLAG